MGVIQSNQQDHFKTRGLTGQLCLYYVLSRKRLLSVFFLDEATLKWFARMRRARPMFITRPGRRGRARCPMTCRRHGTAHVRSSGCDNRRSQQGCHTSGRRKSGCLNSQTD